MPSPTQRVLDATDIERAIAEAFPGRRVVDCAQLTGGGFATVWSARLDDGADVVLTVGGGGVRFGAPVLRRLSLYRLHLYLLMTVEMPSRRITREERPERYERLAQLLDAELTELGRPVPVSG